MSAPKRPHTVRPMVRARVAGFPRLKWLLLLVLLGVFGAFIWQWTASVKSSPLIPVTPSPFPSPTPAIPLGGRNTPTAPTQIGIIAGHNRIKTLANGDVIRDPEGVADPGAICEDGSAQEADITLAIARRVANELRTQDNLSVELLGEFDPRLRGYFGAALVSLHVDACIHNVSGYKVARLITSSVPDTEDRLVNCLRARYQSVTDLNEHRNTITPDMQEYHAFREIALTTPGAIIELGFLRDDQAILKQGDLPTRGVVEGIRCFLNKK